MQIDFSQLIQEALQVQYDRFIRIVEDAKHLICRENGKTGNLDIAGRLVTLKSEGEALIIGDLHGDLESLIDIMQGSYFIKKMNLKKNNILIFLGDYGDRGEYSKEIYYIVLKLKLIFPEQVILMRGNHEGPEDLPASPHDLPLEFQMKFGEKWQEAYSTIRNLFDCLYNAVLVEERYLMIHGGLPHQAKTLKDLAQAHHLHPKESFLEEMLWSDPDEMVNETCFSPRGAGKLFGKKITNEILERFNVKILLRGHEPCVEGFKINHNGKILTLFSRKGSPYFNAYGAYLYLDLSKKFEKAEELIPHIYKF
ncbi:serine/threonine protein phosphatase [Candidatus Bathyarchaeota archaeon]|nr:serine/threonine protein phosphatase [Candidatus Bathyarchaeota archaeon]